MKERYKMTLRKLIEMMDDNTDVLVVQGGNELWLGFLDDYAFECLCDYTECIVKSVAVDDWQLVIEIE